MAKRLFLEALGGASGRWGAAGTGRRLLELNQLLTLESACFVLTVGEDPSEPEVSGSRGSGVEGGLDLGTRTMS